MPSSLSIDLLFKTFHYCTYAPNRLIPQTIILCQNIEGHADILRIDKTDNPLEVFMFKSFLPYAAASFALLLLRSEEHSSELLSLMRNSYAVCCLKKNNNPII